MSSVMLVSTASNIGGMERVVCGLSRGLSARGLSVRTFFPASDHDDALLRWCSEQGVDAEVDPAVVDAAAPHSLETARALRRLIRAVDPDVVNLHYGDNFLSMWDVIGTRAAGGPAPLVVSIHHPTAWTASSRRKRLMTSLGARASSTIATFSTATRDVVLAAGVSPERVRIIACGVRIPDTRMTRAQARRILGLDPHTFVVATLARLVEYKGIDRLIAAMDCCELSGSVLLVGGDGPVRPMLEDQARTTERVTVQFLGQLVDVSPLFAACDVFALPSRLEGFGLVFVEAAMFGVPSIATRVGGVPDAVVDRETGVLVELDDDRALRDALIELATDRVLRERLGAAARERAESELDEGTMVRRYAALFDELASGRRR